MREVMLRSARNVSTEDLRRDLEVIIAFYGGVPIGRVNHIAHDQLSIKQIDFYEIPRAGSIITFTNDFNYIEEPANTPEGKIWYIAKIYLSGFREDSDYFKALNNSFEYLNNHYMKSWFS
jgi:hypothetical protein